MIKNLFFKLIFLFALMFILSPNAQAVLYIDDTSTTDKGHFYADFTVDYYKDVEKEFDPDSEEFTKTIAKEAWLTSSLYYGLTDNGEVGAIFYYAFLDGSDTGEVDGISDIIIDGKYRFWDETDIWPSYAFYFGLKTDSGDDDKSLGTGKMDYTINNILTKSVGDYIFDLNLGYTFYELDADDLFFYIFDIYKDLTEKLGIDFEIYGDTDFRGNFDDNTFCLGLSLGYEITEIIYLELGVGAGISKVSPDYQISSTISFSF